MLGFNSRPAQDAAMDLLPVGSVSPSAKAGVSAEDEERYRVFACELVQDGGVLLGQPQSVMVTGQAMVQRFVWRQSLTAVDAHQVAMAAVFLASKVEECSRSAKDVVNVFHHLKCLRQRAGDDAADAADAVDTAAPPAPLLPTSAAFESWKQALLHTEAMMLKDLGFCLYSLTHHPHRFLPYFVQVLGGGATLAQRAWCYLNDSSRLDVCARYPSETIACVAILLAARETRTALPASPPWFLLLAPRTNLAELQRIAARVLALYTAPKLAWLPSLRPAAEAPKKAGT